MCCLGLENKVRKEWAEDANTMAAQGWLPIKFPGRTKTTSVLGLVTLRGITTRPFAMIHTRHSTPQPPQMQATTQSRAMPCAHLAGPHDSRRLLLQPPIRHCDKPDGGRARRSVGQHTVSSIPPSLTAPRARLAYHLGGFVTNPREECGLIRRRGKKAVVEKKAEWRVPYQTLALFVREPGVQLDRSPATDLQPSRRAARQRRFQ